MLLASLYFEVHTSGVHAMAENTPVQLMYSGSDVEDGTVPVDYMVDALVGFSSAYGKIARCRQSNDIAHRLRVVGLQRGSAKILVDVVEWATKNPATSGVLVTAATAIGGGAYIVLKDIAAVIRGKKHLAGAPIENHYTFNGPTVVLQNQSGEQLEFTKEQFEYLQSGILDPDLDKLTSPLEEGHVEEFKLTSGEEELAQVTAKERVYFIHIDRTVTVTKDDIWMEGTLNSHSKSNNRGTFHTLSGKHIPYRYVGDDVQPLLKGYAFDGAVRVRCKVTLDADMNPTGMEIYDVELGQAALF